MSLGSTNYRKGCHYRNSQDRFDLSGHLERRVEIVQDKDQPETQPQARREGKQKEMAHVGGDRVFPGNGPGRGSGTVHLSAFFPC